MVCAIVAATVMVGVTRAEATWWRGRPVAYYSSYCYTPSCVSCCDPCYGNWYLGVRPGPIRRLLFGPYRWYYAGGGYCWNTCYYDCCWDTCCYDVGVCDAVGEPTRAPEIKQLEPAPAKPAEPKAAPEMPAPAVEPPAVEPPAVEAPVEPKPEIKLPGAMILPTRENSGLLTVWVPAKAKVYVNGLLTKSKGSRRRFVSHGLKPGMTYKYEVRVELVRDGKIAEETRVVYLAAGASEGLAFGFNTRPAQQFASVE